MGKTTKFLFLLISCIQQMMYTLKSIFMALVIFHKGALLLSLKFLRTKNMSTDNRLEISRNVHTSHLHFVVCEESSTFHSSIQS